ITRWLEIVSAETGNGKFARLRALEMGGFVFSGQLLVLDLALQFHEGVEQRFRSRRATGNANIDRDVTVDSLQNVVTLLEWPAGIAPTPVVELLRRRHPDAAFLQLAPKAFVDLVLAHGAGVRIRAQSKQPLLQAQTRPSSRSRRKTRIAMNAPNGRPVNATANGTRKIASTSKIRKMMQ